MGRRNLIKELVHYIDPHQATLKELNQLVQTARDAHLRNSARHLNDTKLTIEHSQIQCEEILNLALNALNLATLKRTHVIPPQDQKRRKPFIILQWLRNTAAANKQDFHALLIHMQNLFEKIRYLAQVFTLARPIQSSTQPPISEEDFLITAKLYQALATIDVSTLGQQLTGALQTGSFTTASKKSITALIISLNECDEDLKNLHNSLLCHNILAKQAIEKKIFTSTADPTPRPETVQRKTTFA